ncbi:unnamed protein product [Closterium sp. Yama58-4]|nr:unnamed protein product [Closterium sp. Yama58-4]
MHTGDSPSGLQGLLQYFRLVEGCWDTIQSFEATSAAPPLRYNWIVRARLDSLWTAPAPIQPPPPILPPSVPPIATTTAAAPAAAATAAAAAAAAAILNGSGVGGGLAYMIPYGSDWWGLNDRFGMGGRQASAVAMKRLSALALLARSKMRGLNSERAFKAQLSFGGITVQRANLSFCVLSQRTYRDGCAPTVYSLNSSVPLNGAKCRPCSRPCATGEQARALLSRVAPSAPNWPGPAAGEGEVGVCDAARGWEEGWEGEFDAVMGGEMAEGRRKVMREAMGSIEECVKAWEEVSGDSGEEEGWEGEFDAVMGEEMAEGRRQVVREAKGSIEECVKAWDEVRLRGVGSGRGEIEMRRGDASNGAACILLLFLRANSGGVKRRLVRDDTNAHGAAHQHEEVDDTNAHGAAHQHEEVDDTNAHGAAFASLSFLGVNSQVVVAVEGSQDSNALLTNQLSQEGDEGSSSGGVKRRMLRDDTTKAHGAAVASDTVAADTVEFDTVASDTETTDTVAPDTVTPETVQHGNIAPGTLDADTGTVATAVDAGVLRAWKEDLGRRIKGISISHRPLAWLLSEAEKEGAPIDVLLVSE